MKIRYVKQEDIDKLKWDSCVHYSYNGNIFGYKWYLDFIAKEWDALVEGDYESVFPLVWKANTAGKKYLYQPKLMRELGVFSINVMSKKRVSTFLNFIWDQFEEIDIVLNERSPIPDEDRFSTVPMTNYQLSLKEQYESLSEKYSIELRQQLDKNHGLSLNTSITPEKLAHFYREQQGIGDQEFYGLQRVMYNALHRGRGSASSVWDSNGNLLASNFFLFSHGKAISLAPAVSKAGAAMGALEFLFDIFIRTNAGNPLTLDFNDNKEAFLSFGARANQYYRILKT